MKAQTASDVMLAPEDYVRIAATVALALGPAQTKALLEVPDAELGRQIRKAVRFALKSAPLLFETPPCRREAPKRALASEHLDLTAFEQKAAQSRKKLVIDGQLLAPATMWERLGVTRQALNKALSSGRMFTVDVGAEQYYPAFYLSEDLDRRKLEKVTQLLKDLPGWSKWQFFTTPKASLNSVTPLHALKRGLLEQVKDAAKAFAER